MEGQQPLDSSVYDAVIVGNGPSAMILSFILHGNIPYYSVNSPHPDPILHAKLKDSPELLHLDVDRLTCHFEASRFPYSTQSLPINSLIDSLVRPLGETDESDSPTCITWRYEPHRAVPHLLLGNAPQPGGQWTECPPGTKWDVQSLSYAGMLSLPQYSYYDHHLAVHGSPLPAYTRPCRRGMAEYLKAYPDAVGIKDSIRSQRTVSNVSRTATGFYIGSHDIHCKHLILASGIFTEVKPARPLLQPLLNMPNQQNLPAKNKAPLLVIGSGFSAADVIISAEMEQKIIHIFKWDPDRNPSPLRSCHQQAYPEYAGIYRLMKRSNPLKSSAAMGKRGQASLSPFLSSREWDNIYEPLPNTLVVDVVVTEVGAIVTFRGQDGSIFERPVSGLSYAVGRKGSLSYLDHNLQREIFGPAFDGQDASVAKDTLKPPLVDNLEVTKDVFIIGSLTGDSLIRYAYGGCVYAAGRLMERSSHIPNHIDEKNQEAPVNTGHRPDAYEFVTHSPDIKSSLDNSVTPVDQRMHRVSPELRLGSRNDRFGGRRQKPWWAFLFSWW